MLLKMSNVALQKIGPQLEQETKNGSEETLSDKKTIEIQEEKDDEKTLKKIKRKKRLRKRIRNTRETSVNPINKMKIPIDITPYELSIVYIYIMSSSN